LVAQRHRGHDLGVGVEQPQRVIGRRARFRFGDCVAEAPVERELAVPRQRDLAAGIAAFGDVPLDQLDQPIDLFLAEAERLEIGGRQRKARAGSLANGSVHGFPPETILLPLQDTSMTTISTYCVSKNLCHNASHVRSDPRPHRLSK
jgi:hypothetical protein